MKREVERQMTTEAQRSVAVRNACEAIRRYEADPHVEPSFLVKQIGPRGCGRLAPSSLQP